MSSAEAPFDHLRPQLPGAAIMSLCKKATENLRRLKRALNFQAGKDLGLCTASSVKSINVALIVVPGLITNRGLLLTRTVVGVTEDKFGMRLRHHWSDRVLSQWEQTEQARL